MSPAGPGGCLPITRIAPFYPWSPARQPLPFDHAHALWQDRPTTAVALSALCQGGRTRLMEKGTLGVIAEGAYADRLVVEGNPLADLGVVMNPQKNLKLIMKNGTIYKNELAA